MNKSILAACVTLSICSAPAYAFSLGPVTLPLGGGSQSSGTDLAAIQDNTVRDYVAASQLVLSANMKMAQALHLDAEVAALKASSDALKAGTSEDALKSSDVTLSKSTDDIVTSLKSNPTLDAGAKATFSAGMVDLASGAIAYAKVGKELSSSQSALSSASPMALMKLGSLVYMAKALPGNAKSFGGALGAATQFAKGQDIPVPANAVDATAALGSL